MAFECLQCGECCSYLGQVHTLVKEISKTEFLVRNEYTNEEKVVTLDPDKTEWYSDRSIYERWPEACPFLRPDPETPGRICCCVHLTRPDMCRSYDCWRILILNKDGSYAGRVMGPQILHFKDPVLKKLWDEKIRPVIESDHGIPDEDMFAILKENGYLIRE